MSNITERFGLNYLIKSERGTPVADPTYQTELIKANPIWELAFTLSEIQNDGAPLGWGKYIYTAELLMRKYDIKLKGPKNKPTNSTPQSPNEHLQTEVDPSSPPAALYCDGGVIGKNPSPLGGTWAWCGVDKQGNRIIERGGFVPAPPGILITNNHTEQIAICLALESMPDGWSGLVCSDSQIALGRVFLGWNTKNLPSNIQERCTTVVGHMGKIETKLLQGHPTKADLLSGIGKKRNLPVSSHNVWCDKECNRQKELFYAKQKDGSD